MTIPIDVNSIHGPHSQIRAEDWRSPLVRRLLGSDEYRDGSKQMSSSFIGESDTVPTNETLVMSWSGLASDFNKTVKTYQVPVITEFATLGLACGLVTAFTGLEITEVTRRGERADYWLGDRKLMMEISGQDSGDISKLCEQKSAQLAENPYGKPGFVCVASYSELSARLWYYAAEDAEVENE